MRPHVELLLLAGLAPLLAMAEDIESNDFPVACRPACQPAVDLTARCDKTTNSDQAERDCICKGQDAQSQFAACAACVKAAPLPSNNDRDDDDRNDDRNDDRDDGDDDNGQQDLGKLMRTCGWDINSISATSGGPATTKPPSPSASGSGGGAVLTSVTGSNGQPTMSPVTPAGSSPTGTNVPDSAGSMATSHLGLAVGGAMAGMLWGLQAWL